MADTAKITKRPSCDLCKYIDHRENVPAFYDGKTINGPWGYMCEHHFATYGVGLGTGRGQRLIVSE